MYKAHRWKNKNLTSRSAHALSIHRKQVAVSKENYRKPYFSQLFHWIKPQKDSHFASEVSFERTYLSGPPGGATTALQQTFFPSSSGKNAHWRIQTSCTLNTAKNNRHRRAIVTSWIDQSRKYETLEKVLRTNEKNGCVDKKLHLLKKSFWKNL